MTMGSVARVVAIVLLFVLGGSGALVGFQLLAAMATGGAGSGAWIAGAVGGYGMVLVAAGAGLLQDRRWGRPLGVVAILAGLAVLVALLAISGGRDAILLGGAIVWLAVLVCLLVARRERGAGIR